MLRAAFQIFDRDHSGTIDLQESLSFVIVRQAVFSSPKAKYGVPTPSKGGVGVTQHFFRVLFQGAVAGCCCRMLLQGAVAGCCCRL